MSNFGFPLLLVVADRGYVGDDIRWLELLRAVANAACGTRTAVQVRAKGVSGEAFRELAMQARDAVPAQVPLFLNGNVALAMALGYDGVHWPEATIPASLGVDTLAWHSAAVHSVAAVRAAADAGADVLVWGAVFEPGSHPGAASGLDALSLGVRAAGSRPLIAIGGITPERVADCLGAGASGVAVVSGVLGARSPAEAVTRYLAALEAASTATTIRRPLQKGTAR